MKPILALNLTQLLALSLLEASALFEKTTGKPPAPTLTLEVMLDEILAVADPAPDLDFEDDDTFIYEGKEYEVIVPKVEIPGLGVRTALEILLDEEAQAYLVKAGCVGTVIREVE